MKKIITLLSLVLFISVGYSQNFYDFKVETIDGKNFDFSSLKGKKVMIVNTASKCGYTPQYKDLEKLYKQYGGDNFVIIGFPANNFMNQEPGTNEDIANFCQKNYGVSFPMMAKISVKGNDIHPVYKWLTDKKQNGKMNSSVRWNFQKYIIDEKGNLLEVFPPKTSPTDQRIIDLIK